MPKPANAQTPAEHMEAAATEPSPGKLALARIAQFQPIPRNWTDPEQVADFMGEIFHQSSLSDEEAVLVLEELAGNHRLGADAWLPSLVDQNDGTRLSAEVRALGADKPKCALWIVEHCGGDADSPCNDGSPLGFYMKPDHARRLLELGASPLATDADGDSWLARLASRSGAVAITAEEDRLATALIAAGADIDARNLLGESALHAAAQRGNVKWVHWLIGRGADADALDRKNRSPMDIALAFDKPKSAGMLRELALARSQAKELASQAAELDADWIALGRAAMALIESGRLHLDGSPATKRSMLDAMARKPGGKRRI